MGDRGRFVIPMSVRERQKWEQGTVLHLIESDAGVVVVTREQLHDLVLKQLDGQTLVDSLIADRREEARSEALAS